LDLDEELRGAPETTRLLVSSRALLVVALRCYHRAGEERAAAETAWTKAEERRLEWRALLRQVEQTKPRDHRAEQKLAHELHRASVARAEALLVLERAKQRENVWADRVMRAANYVSKATEWRAEERAKEAVEEARTGKRAADEWVPECLKGDAWE